MATTTAAPRTLTNTQDRALIAGKRRARFNEALLGLLFVSPVAIIAIVFQLFPIMYGFYLSMQGGIIIPEGFVGLRNYTRAVGSIAYMLMFALAFIFAAGGYSFYRKGINDQREGKGSFTAYLPAGFLGGISSLSLFLVIFFSGAALALIPAGGVVIAFIWFTWLNNKRGQPQGGAPFSASALGVGVFMPAAVLLTLFTFGELNGAMEMLLQVLRALIQDVRYQYIFPQMSQILAFVGAAVCVVGAVAAHEMRRRVDAEMNPGRAGLLGLSRWVFGGIALMLLAYVVGAQEALRTSILAMGDVTNNTVRSTSQALIGQRISLEGLLNGLLAWNEVFSMLIGIGAIGLAWYIWGLTRRTESVLSLISAVLMSILLMVGGLLFLGVLPEAGSSGDPEFFKSMLRTFSYALLTVPVQLGIGLMLAYLLYYEVKWGKGFYRIVFFMPYIAPVVVTAAVFSAIFSLRPAAPANQLIQALGFPPQEWLRNPKGIFQILAEIIGGSGVRLPDFLVGPSLPLFSAIIYSIWVFSGYNAVIFMAGFGNVPKEMYEAAQVDGAGRWSTFRKIIFPLISPTTFFLTVLAIIGTLRSFSHIWVLRTDAARGAMDTTTVYVYTILIETSAIKTRPYAAAMSFLLFGVILVMTIVQNRYSKDRVFYG